MLRLALVDGMKGPDSACLNHDGASSVTWTPSAIATGSHDVDVVCIYDLGRFADTVTLTFARP